ncbi:MAG: RNA polymerase sigma factor [Aquimonas sp.]|nr:RNA polymerase sigma factor [Aquimonas sp.]
MSDAPAPRRLQAVPDPGRPEDPLQALARRAAAGEVAAFEQLYRDQRARLHALIWRLTGGAGARSEELLQDTFLAAWRALPGFRFESSVATWLHRLAMNTALMDLRGRRESEDLETDDAALEHMPRPCERSELRHDLARGMLQLPPRARAVLVLHDIEGLTHQEIGAALGIAAGSCKAHLFRARRLLRLWFDDSTPATEGVNK